MTRCFTFSPTVVDTISAIILDLGNVVLNYDHGRSVRRIAQLAGRPEEAVESFMFGDLKNDFNRGKLSAIGFYEQVRERFDLPICLDAFTQVWSDIFWENPDVVELLPALSKKYPLYLLTNTDILHFKYILDNFAVIPHFRKVFASYQMGTAKPDKEIYLQALQSIAQPASRVLYVDDEPAFVAAARECGMQAIHYFPSTELRTALRTFNIHL
jgi:HAD superfamily hydrolase (TIGR01509 family)